MAPIEAMRIAAGMAADGASPNAAIPGWWMEGGTTNQLGKSFSQQLYNPTRQPNNIEIIIIIQNTAIIYGLVILTGQGHGPQRV